MSKIPQGAIDEINGILARDHCIRARTGAAIIRRHRTPLDPDVLEEQYYRTLLSRYMATYRDSKGRRNYLAFNTGEGDCEYRFVDLVEDRRALETLSHKIQAQITGKGITNEKVQNRIAVIRAIESHLSSGLST